MRTLEASVAALLSAWSAEMPATIHRAHWQGRSGACNTCDKDFL